MKFRIYVLPRSSWTAVDRTVENLRNIFSFKFDTIVVVPNLYGLSP